MDLKRMLTDEWCSGYQQAKGCKYAFQSAKDGAAAARLVKMGLPISEILATARQAWNHPDWFNCKQAASLSGFACRFNEIRDELKHPPSNGTILAIQRDELNRILNEMKNIRYSYSENLSWKAQDIARYKTLRQRRDELKQALGVKI